MYYSHNKYWTRVAWGVAGGFVTGFWNFIKDAITLVQLSPSLWNLPWYFFGLCATALVTAGAGMMIMAECMKRYDATYTSGTYAGSLTLAASVVSAMHYRTFDNLSGVSLVLYPLGLGILMMGVGLLIMHDGPASESNQHPVTNPQTIQQLSKSKNITISGKQRFISLFSDRNTCPTHDPNGYLRLRTAQLV